MITKVVGVTFSNEKYKVDRQDIIKHLKGDEKIILRREPKNRFDKNAIGVFVELDYQTLQIGYLKAELSGMLSEMWKEYRFNSSIDQIRPGNEVNNIPRGISLSITKTRINQRSKKQERIKATPKKMKRK